MLCVGAAIKSGVLSTSCVMPCSAHSCLDTTTNKYFCQFSTIKISRYALLRPPICGALEKHLLTYLYTTCCYGDSKNYNNTTINRTNSELVVAPKQRQPQIMQNNSSMLKNVQTILLKYCFTDVRSDHVNCLLPPSLSSLPIWFSWKDLVNEKTKRLVLFRTQGPEKTFHSHHWSLTTTRMHCFDITTEMVTHLKVLL